MSKKEEGLKDKVSHEVMSTRQNQMKWIKHYVVL